MFRRTGELFQARNIGVIMEEIEDVYTNPRKPGSFQGVDKVKRALPTNIKKNQVSSYLKGKESYSIHRTVNRKFSRSPIIAAFIDAQWQGDLADMSGWAEYNDGVRFLLVMIDIVSKYLWVEPLQTKHGEEVLKGFKAILQKDNRKPQKLQTDDGKEFWYNKFQSFLEENKIFFFTLKSEKKAAIAERVIRTLKDKIHRYLTEKNTKRYIHILQDLVASYNDTYHTSIKMAPSEVNEENEGLILETLYGHLWKTPSKYSKKNWKPGVFVRLSTSKGKFEKGFVGNWTEEVFIIHQALNVTPVRYIVKDWNGQIIKGTFYQKELQEIIVEEDGFWKVESVLKKRRVGRKVEYLVKWQGHDMTSWVNARDIKGI